MIHPDNTATFFVGKTDGGQGTGTAFRQMMCDELDIAYDKTSLVMGTHRHHSRPGRLGRFRRHRARRLADAPSRRRSAARAARARLPSAWARRSPMLAVSNGTISAEVRSLRSRSPTPSSSAASASTSRSRDATSMRPPARPRVKPVSELRVVGTVGAALRHSRQGRRVVDVGRGHESAGHAPRAQRAAAGRGRDAAQHRRVVGGRRARVRPRRAAAATTWPWSASARSRPSAPRGN